MSKFKKGDRVVSVKTGTKGVVDEVYGEEKYAVLFDGAANPDRVEGHQIKAANATPTRGFSFKVGDKAMLAWSKPGAGEIVKLTGKTPAGLFKFKMRDGDEGQVEEKDLAPASMHISTNSVVRNAMAARTARNDSVGEIAAEGISLSREALEKLKRAIPMIEKWIASGKGHPNAVADGKRLVGGIKKAVAILNPVV